MRGRDICDELCRQLKCKNDSELAKIVGLTPARISQLRKGNKKIDARYVAMFVTRVAEKHAANTLRATIRPIVEFFPIEKSQVRDKGRDIPFSAQHKQGKDLANHLRSAVGLYAFYNSQAEIIYFGKTEKLNLYDEIVNAYNRPLPNYQIYRVRHPWGKYKSSSKEGLRKIRKENVTLSESASYFSAYSIADDFIGALESLLIRLVPNDLINARIESKDMRAFALPEV